MKLTKQQKIESSKVLAEKLKAAPHLFFTEFQGMKFVELDELRMQLKPLKCRYAVVKNSLIKYALKNAGVDGIDQGLSGNRLTDAIVRTDWHVRVVR